MLKRWLHILMCVCVFVAYFRPHSAGGVQHAAPASEAQCGLWTHRILRLHQHRHQDHQGARGETATGSRHQDYRCVCELNTTDISRSSPSFFFSLLWSVSFEIRLICKHVTHVSALGSDAVHHGKDPYSRHAFHTTLYRLRVSTAATTYCFFTKKIPQINIIKHYCGR